jgi:hypothetical protein
MAQVQVRSELARWFRFDAVAPLGQILGPQRMFCNLTAAVTAYEAREKTV